MSSTKKNNSRMESLLKSVKLQDRLLPDSINVGQIGLDVPNLNISQVVLAKMREQSISFLTKNI